jgi:soluble lytic murein transglycosylase-like protein
MPFVRPTAALAGIVVVSTLALAPAVGADEHTVAPGENLTGIAARYCTSVGDVAARNAVTDPNTIYAGTRLDVVNRCAPAPSAGHHEIASHLHLVPVFRAAATEFDVPVDLLMALSFTESRWRNEQVSATGAIGIGQLLPATADWLRVLMDEPDLDESNVTDNARMSARLLRFLLDRTDDETSLALAAYFQGIGDVRRNGVDAGGRRYANTVLERRAWFAEL